MIILSYNILEGGTGRVDPLAEVIRLANADIVLLQETWDQDAFHRLADRLHMDRFLAENPHKPQASVGLLTRLDIREAVNLTPLDPRFTRGALYATVASLPLVNLHLHARETPEDEALRLTELAALEPLLQRLPPAHLLAGDFNTSHPDQPIDLRKLRPNIRDRVLAKGWTGKNFPRQVVARLLSQGYVDTHAATRSPDQFDTSLSTSHPGMRTDYLFVTPPLAPKVRSSIIFKPEIARFASDHYPALAEIDL